MALSCAVWGISGAFPGEDTAERGIAIKWTKSGGRVWC